MSKIDLKLRYQQETGLGLEHIQNILSRAQSSILVECKDCSSEWEEDIEIDEDLIAYIEWLEDNIIRLQRGVDAWESANIIATAAHKAVKKQK